MLDESNPHVIEIHLDQLDERVRIFRAGQEVDSFVLVTQRYIVLVDTMATPELAQEIVQIVKPLLRGRQQLVINTHADYDHCWGNAVFASPNGFFPAPIIAHEKMRKRLQSEQTQIYLHEQQQAERRFANVRIVEPTITFSDRMCIDGGDLTLELLPTPGHTEDHISIWIPELRVLLAGDAAEHPIPEVGSAAALPILRKSLEQLIGLNAVQVLPCHGETTGPDLLTRNQSYFSTLENQVRHAIATGQVPPHWREEENLPALIDLSYEKVVPTKEDLTDEMKAFYRQCHLKAVRAMLANMLK